VFDGVGQSTETDIIIHISHDGGVNIQYPLTVDTITRITATMAAIDTLRNQLYSLAQDAVKIITDQQLG